MKRPTPIAVLAAAASLLAAAPAAAATLPEVTTGPATNLEHTAATLTGTVNPQGLALSDCRFQFLPQTQYNHEEEGFASVTASEEAPCSEPDAAEVGAGSGPVAVHADLGGLAPGILYRYRLLAANANGSATDPGLFFTPPGLPGIAGFAMGAADAAAHPYSEAGGHPYALTTNIALNTEQIPNGEGFAAPETFPVEDPRDIAVTLPPGLIGDPQAAPMCSLEEFAASECRTDSQIGTVRILLRIGDFKVPVYNLEPQFGHAAQLGFLVAGGAGGQGGVPFQLTGAVAGDGAYTIRIAQTGVPMEHVYSISMTIWGVPADSSHDPERGRVCGPECKGGGVPSTAPRLPYLTEPTACPGQELSAGLAIETYERPGAFLTASAQMPAIVGCNALHFEPKIKARPSTDLADSPAGLDFDLEVPQPQEPEGKAEAGLRDVSVTLPPGLVLDPSAANGLAACSEEAVGYQPGSRAPYRFDEAPARCPEASRIGKLEVETPLVATHEGGHATGLHVLPGSIYLAAPHANPTGGLLALYLVVEDPYSSTVLKLAGAVSADPQSGRLTTSFEEDPQLPFEHFRLHFFGGARGPLRTPPTCGAYETTSLITPWSAPEGLDARPGDEFQITGSASGEGACPNSPTEEPNTPIFHAGTENVQAGKFSPFAFKLRREDGSQEFSKIETTLPPGLVGRLAGVGECSEAQLAVAQSREREGGGQEERESPSCPASSEVGSVEVGAGAGPTPYYTTGRAYLAGPYKGSPLSLAIITPAVAGPFDLGNVVVRTALYVDPFTAQIKAVSDPIPNILSGIPLDVRSVTLKMDRPGFTLNPTDCEELGFTGNETSVLEQSAPLTQRFQVSGCRALGFEPHLSLRLKGSPKRAHFPALTATLTMPRPGIRKFRCKKHGKLRHCRVRVPEQANIASAQVTLPHSSFLANAHIQKTCSRPALESHSCPADSVYGHAKAVTPLLDHPLEGPVYLVTGFGYELPALVADLNGQIEVTLAGKVDTGRADGIRNTFEVVPDAPVSKFTLHMFGGKKSLIENSQYLCGKRAKTTALAVFTAQNGKVSVTEPTVANSCKRHAHHRRHKGRRHHKRRGAG